MHKMTNQNTQNILHSNDDGNNKFLFHTVLFATRGFAHVCLQKIIKSISPHERMGRRGTP